jgi:hypothetical protein
MKSSTRVAIALVLAFTVTIAVPSPSSSQGTVADEFSAGVLGFPWGSGLDDVVRNFPPGVAWPLTSHDTEPRGERYFSVPDDTPILGVERKNQHTMFGFDQSDRLIHAIFSIPYAAKDELLKRARMQFGAIKKFQVEGFQQRRVWGPVNGIGVMIIDIPEKSHPSLFVMVFSNLK